MLTEDIIRELMAKIEDKARVPNDWLGVSDRKVVDLSDVIDILNEYSSERIGGCYNR